jgi:hypothetical protein
MSAPVSMRRLPRTREPMERILDSTPFSIHMNVGVSGDEVKLNLGLPQRRRQQR